VCHLCVTIHMNANDQYEYPYHYATRKLTIDELQLLRHDLVSAAAYTTKYHIMFDRPDRGWSRDLDTQYIQIQDTLEKILHRGLATERYSALQQTPLLVADIYVYLWEILEFMQCRTKPGSIYQINPDKIPRGWRIDETALIHMEKDVLRMLAEISPPDVRLHAEISQAIHHAVHRATR
jgi:hypothetical protein